MDDQERRKKREHKSPTEKMKGCWRNRGTLNVCYKLVFYFTS